MGDILKAIHDERYRQDELQRRGKFPFTAATPSGLTDAEKLGVLAEEFGEVAQLVCRVNIPNRLLPTEECNRYHIQLKEELIQIAAVCVAWCEAIEDKKMKEDYNNITNPLTLLRSAWFQAAKAYDVIQPPDDDLSSAIVHAQNAKAALDKFLEETNNEIARRKR